MGIQQEKEREGEGERERESRHGGSQISKKPVQEAGLRNWPILHCLGKLFILLVVHRDQWIIQSHAGFAALGFFSAYLAVYTSLR